MATAKNTNELLSSVADSADVGTDITHLGLWDAQTGGNFIIGRAVTGDPDAIAVGEQFRILAETFVITLASDAHSSETMATRGLNGIISGTTYISFHTGDPGKTGANEIAVARFARVAISDWTVA